jgi:hypothetical protein
MPSPTTIMLGIGFVGILIVFLFSLSMGKSHGAGPLISIGSGSGQCDSDVPKPVSRASISKPSSYALSSVPAAGACPTGYTQYNDMGGNSLCCASSNIDQYGHTCSAKGATGICAMVPGIDDARGGSQPYPLCQAIVKQQQEMNSGRLCPRRFPNYVSIPGVHKCCGGVPNAAGTDCLSGASCTSLLSGQTVFNTPNSCDRLLLNESLQCPPGTHMVSDMKGTSVKTQNLTLPICVGVSGNCFPNEVLQSLQANGLFTDINIQTNILNCDVYNKVYVDRVLQVSQAENKKPADME